MADVNLNARISLKYDTLENWEASNPKLLKGEVALVSISSAVAGLPPQILFKVGDGTNKFLDLPWASGLAADVYAWAKSKNKPEYNKSEIGLANVDNIKQYSASNKPNIDDINGLQSALDLKQNKVPAIILTAETGTLSAEQREIISTEPFTKIIVNDIIFRLSVKNDSDKKYIYCATKTLDGTNVNNVKLDLNLNSGEYTISVFETKAVETLKTKVNTLETATDNIQEQVTEHIDNTEVHLQPGEREKWNNKVSSTVTESGTENTLELNKG